MKLFKNIKKCVSKSDQYFEVEHSLSESTRKLVIEKSSYEHAKKCLDLVKKTNGVCLWQMEKDVSAEHPFHPQNKCIWSDELRHMLGYNNEKDFPNVFGSLSGKVNTADKPVLKKLLLYLNGSEGESSFEAEYRVKLGTGEYHWVRTDVSVVRNEEGVPVQVIGTLCDIHDKKIYERQVEELKASLNIASKIANIGLWNMQIHDGEAYSADNMFEWSEGFCKLLGFLNKKELSSEAYSFIDRIHPDDKEKTIKAFLDHINDLSGRIPYCMDCRIKTKQGKYRLFHIEAYTVRDNSGAPLKVTGSMVDITHQWTKPEIQKELPKSIDNLSDSLQKIINSIDGISKTAKELSEFGNNTIKASKKSDENTRKKLENL